MIRPWAICLPEIATASSGLGGLIRAFNLPIFIPSAHDSFLLSITAIPKKNNCPSAFYDAEIP
jgi:hypothetical protein